MSRPSLASARRRVAYAAALVATPILHGLSFPEARLAPLAWIAFVPWFMALRLARPRPAIVLTVVVTLAGTYLVAQWLPRAVANYYMQPAIVGFGLFVGAYMTTVAPWCVGFAVSYRLMARRWRRALPFGVGAAWVTAELCRVRLGMNDPFGLVGYTQVRSIPLVQVAELTGVYGVSFLIVIVNAALAEVCLALGRRRGLADAMVGATLAGISIAAVLVFGLWRMAGPVPSAPAVRVAVAQANLDLGSQWRQELYGRNLEEYMRLTLQVLAERPALVVWPESAMTFFLEDEPLYRKSIGSLLQRPGIQLVAGGPRTSGESSPRYHNSAFLIGPDGEILSRYDKQRLLPFAEYFPFASVDLLRREFGRVREFTPGTTLTPLPTAIGPAGVVICNEAMFPELVSARVRAGATFLLNLTNDSWLNDAQFSDQAFDMGRLRAVEQRRWLVRASTSGPSAIVDPFGRVVAQTQPFTRDTLGGTIQPSSALTVYARVGDAFAIVCAAVTLAGVLAGLGRRG